MLIELTDRRIADLIQEAAKANAPAGSDLRKIGDYYASFMDTTAIDAAGLKPLQPTLDSIAAIHDRKDLARVPRLRPPRRRRRAQRHQLLHREPVRPVGRAGPRRSHPLLAVPAPGRARHARPELLPRLVGRAWRRSARSTRPHVAGHARRWPSIAGRRGQGRGDRRRSRPKIASAHCEPRGSRATSPRATTTGRGPTSPPRRRASTGTTYFAAAGLGKPARFVVWQPSAVTGISALVASEPLETWKDYLTFHAIQSRARRAARARISQRVLRLLRPGAERRAEAARPLEARRQRHQRRARLRRRQALRRAATSRPPRRPGPRRWWPTSSRRSERGSTSSTGWRRPPRRRPRPSSPCSRSASGYPDKWPDYAGLEVEPGDAFGNAERAELFQLRRSLAKLGQPVDRVGVGDDAADGERGEPAGDERDELPRRDPAAALLRPQAAGGDGLRRHRARSSATRSATASTTRARCSTPRAGCTTGGRRRTSSTSRRRPQQLVAQYDAYKPFPDLAVKGQQTLGENIADVAGLAAAYDAYHRVARRQAGAGGAGLHRRPAVLRELRAELARKVARAGAAEPDPDRRPRAGASTAPRRCGTSTRGIGRSR